MSIPPGLESTYLDSLVTPMKGALPARGLSASHTHHARLNLLRLRHLHLPLAPATPSRVPRGHVGRMPPLHVGTVLGSSVAPARLPTARMSSGRSLVTYADRLDRPRATHMIKHRAKPLYSGHSTCDGTSGRGDPSAAVRGRSHLPDCPVRSWTPQTVQAQW